MANSNEQFCKNCGWHNNAGDKMQNKYCRVFQAQNPEFSEYYKNHITGKTRSRIKCKPKIRKILKKCNMDLSDISNNSYIVKCCNMNINLDCPLFITKEKWNTRANKEMLE